MQSGFNGDLCKKLHFYGLNLKALCHPYLNVL